VRRATIIQAAFPAAAASFRRIGRIIRNGDAGGRIAALFLVQIPLFQGPEPLKALIFHNKPV